MRRAARWMMMVLCVGGFCMAAVPVTRPSAAELQAIGEYRQKLKARGEPSTGADLMRSDKLPDKENAAWYLKQAVIDNNKCGPRGSSLEWSETLPYPPEWFRLAKENVEANAKAFELMHEARKCNAVDWGTRFDVPLEQMIQAKLPPLNGLRALANSGCDAALYRHFNGDDASAIETTRDVLFEASAARQDRTLVSFLVGVGIRALAAYNVQIIATQLGVENAAHPLNPKGTHPATRKQVQELIAIVLDDEALANDFRRVVQAERVLALDQMERGMWPASNPEKSLAIFDRVIQTIGKERYAKLDAPGTADPMTKSYERLSSTLNRVLYCDRAAAVGLAAALYYSDHGKYPARLAELTPEYLPSVPRDPLAKRDQTLWYMLAENGRRPLVWSVGENGVAETTDETVFPDEANYGWHSKQKGENDDQWIDLAAWRK